MSNILRFDQLDAPDRIRFPAPGDQNRTPCPSSFLTRLAASPRVDAVRTRSLSIPVTGSINLGSSLAVRLTAVEISKASRSLSDAGITKDAAVSASAFVQSSQRLNASGAMITGIRS